MASRPASTTCLLTGFFLVLSLPLLFSSLQAQGASKEDEHHHYVVPVRKVVYRQSAAATTTAEEAYEPFQLCEGCQCCAASNASDCVATSCCYAIDCDIPGKPFGVCAFTPRTCGCGGAGAGASNCTQRPS